MGAPQAAGFEAEVAGIVDDAGLDPEAELGVIAQPETPAAKGLHFHPLVVARLQPEHAMAAPFGQPPQEGRSEQAALATEPYAVQRLAAVDRNDQQAFVGGQLGQRARLQFIEGVGRPNCHEEAQQQQAAEQIRTKHARTRYKAQAEGAEVCRSVADLGSAGACRLVAVRRVRHLFEPLQSAQCAALTAGSGHSGR